MKRGNRSPHLLQKVWQHPQGKLGLVLVCLLVVTALAAPLIAPFDPYDVTQRAEKGLSPSFTHLLGTSISTGQDIFSMLVYGTRVSLLVGVVTGLSTMFLADSSGGGFSWRTSSRFSRTVRFRKMDASWGR